MKNPLDEIFVDKIKHPTHSKIVIDEKDKEIEMLKEGISDEIDNIREEMKRIEKRNQYLEKRDKDCMRVFEDDKKIFREQRNKIQDLKESLKTVEKLYSKLSNNYNLTYIHTKMIK